MQIHQDEVLKTISVALNLKSQPVTEASTAQNTSNWDSLGQLDIITALNKLYDGQLRNIKELARADSVKQILAILQQHGLLKQ